MIETFLQTLSQLIEQNTWFAPLLALFAGLLTSFTPCSLSSVPLVIACVGGSTNIETHKAFKLSLTFAFGMAIAFTVLGLIASTAGILLGNAGCWWFILLGILMLLMALQTWGVIDIVPSFAQKSTRRGYLGALITGIFAGLFSSPCATPVLLVLLGLLATHGSIAWGLLVMFCYAFGHALLTIIAGTSIGFVNHLNASSRYTKLSKILKYILGAAILCIAFYMFYLGF